MLIPKIRCSRCGYIWTPRLNRPKKCPRCKNFIENLEKSIINEYGEKLKCLPSSDPN